MYSADVKAQLQQKNHAGLYAPKTQFPQKVVPNLRTKSPSEPIKLPYEKINAAKGFRRLTCLQQSKKRFVRAAFNIGACAYFASKGI